MSVELTDALRQRREFSENRLKDVRRVLEELDAPRVLGGGGTVYATGSMARGDASEHSDLDVFILSKISEDDPELTNLDAIVLKAKLIEMGARLGLPAFSDDGQYLVVHSVTEMLEKLGRAEDDYENLFTARMLLLLESSPLVGADSYERAIQTVVKKYWIDYEGNETDFLPVFLTNDIIRYWKVLCLNYEAFTSGQKESKRRHQNYKLRFSRLLTCYSSIVYLLAVARLNERVTPDDVTRMATLRPIDRLLEASRMLNDINVDRTVSTVLARYETFLGTTDADKDSVRERFENDDYNRERRIEATAFGDGMFELLNLVGSGTPLFRYLVI